MAIFWQHGPLFIKEVLDKMPEPKPHFNTVSTFVRSLEAKGWLTHEQIGHSNRYSPAVTVDEYRNTTLTGMVEKFFNRSYLSFVSALVKEEKISTGELRDLIEQIEMGKEE